MGTAGEAVAARPPLLTLYSRTHCHLCEEMIAGLRELRSRVAFTLDVIDVDRDPALAARFGMDVPVLAHGGRELCRHRMDVPSVAAYLGGFP